MFRLENQFFYRVKRVSFSALIFMILVFGASRFGKAASQRYIPIRFAKGKSSATVSGKIVGGKYVAYTIKARRGQTLEAKGINDDGTVNRDLYIDITGANREFDFAHDYGEVLRGKLPASGEFIIIVESLEKQNLNFKLQVTLR